MYGLIFLVDNKVIAGEHGLIDVLMSVMKMHISNADICCVGCRIIDNITLNTGIIIFKITRREIICNYS